MLGHEAPRVQPLGSGTVMKEEVYWGSWWNMTGKQPLSLGEKMWHLGSHPLASQQHISADLGTGVGLHGSCGALHT